MRWVRWQGLAAFAALMALVLVFWWLFVDWILERTIERTGTLLVGARVDLASADLTLSPAGFELRGLEVTDPAAPMTNAVEVARIAGTFDSLQALRRKVIVEELAVEGVRFGTARERSGAVNGFRPSLEAATETVRIALPSFDFPDPSEILASAGLESLASIEAVRATIERARTRWKERLAALPNEQDLARYRARIERLRAASTLEAVTLGAQLAGDLRKDLKALEEAAGGLEQEMKALELSVREAKQAPQRDLVRLQEQYGLSPTGLGNLTERLLGASIQSGVRQALAWYERLAPLVEQVASRPRAEGPEVVKRVRGRSVLVRYPEREPLPDLLIRHAKASVELAAGDFDGTIRNITPDQAVLGAPLSFAFGGEGLDGIRSIRLSGQLDHIRPGDPRDQLEASLRGYSIEELVLSDDETWPIQLTAGDADADVSVALVGDGLRAKLGLAMRGRLATGFGDSPVATALADALESVDSLRLDVAVGGTRDAPAIEIRSDLDKLLARAVSSLVSGQLRSFEAKLGAALDEQLAGPLADLDGSMAGLDVLSGDLASRESLANELLQEVLARSGGGLRLPGGLLR